MRKVLIVDDEVLMRVTLRSLVDWEKLGFEIAADCNSGYQALEYLDEHTVDLMITDVKMPGISGLELLKQLQKEDKAPVTIILSGYNEFDLVREAFRLGAFDYLIKGEMDENSLAQILTKVREQYWQDDITGTKTAGENTADSSDFPQDGEYVISIMEIDDFQRQTLRFQDDLESSLETPMWELVQQIPRVRKYGKRVKVHSGYYIFLYEIMQKEGYQDNIAGLLKQMQTIWKNYMNLTVSVAVCEMVNAQEIHAAIEKGEELLLLTPLSGKMSLIQEWDKKNLLQRLKLAKVKYEKLVSYLYDINEPATEREKVLFFETLNQIDFEQAKEESLCLITLIALKFREYDGDFYQLFPEEVNYYEKMERLTTIIELERWLNNYFTWILEYLKQQSGGVQTDLILRAKRFMTDNFTNPELSLKSVADYIGLNEKYFSTIFTQKTGSTFRDYLTMVRLEKAKHLLKTTDLKVYEICESIGYNNVEHFNRMFKRMTNMSPGAFRKENVNN